MIAVIFGGKSCEHDVSVITGTQVLGALRKQNPLPIYIDKEGVWKTGKSLFDLRLPRDGRLKRVYLRAGERGLYTRSRKIADIDVAVICCHGHGGEDGCLQGLLTLCGIPYTGPNLFASALCMNKAEFKRVAVAVGIPTLPYATFTRREFNENIYDVADRLNAIGYPFIIKPASLGSSIGVGVARTEAELVEKSRVAFAFDDVVVAEKLLENFREFNCAGLGDERGLTLSEIEEPIGWKEYLTFEDKYAGGGKEAVKRRIPADIPPSLAEEIRDLTKKAFALFGLSGVVRVDYLYDTAQEKLYLNEINTIPGSLASYFFRRQGMRGEQFVLKLIELAEHRAKAEARLTYAYESPVLKGK
ncbi:MAG: D-alanine--D-alanine ligase [Clostridia bacterium]|nr:D-alanine--D-alanine ligase [Clostridia bacterium]